MMMRYNYFFVVLCALAAACGKKTLPELPPGQIQQPPLPSDVESVVFIVGDMGLAVWEESPMPRRMQRDVEWWARALGRDSSVAVVFLGDNIYPAGMHEPNEVEWPADSTHLEAQARILDSPAARSNRAFGVFIAGNHDWGHKFGPGGERRVKNQQDFLARRRERGIQVRLLPPDATPGPGTVDMGRHLRMLFLDTAWWLLSADEGEKLRMMQRLQSQMQSRGNREILIAAHHPIRSASAHGGLNPLFSAFGAKWLLGKTGAALQDLNSLPYRDLLFQLNGVFRATSSPLIFAGGHDHALQVLRANRDEDPRYMLVSGAGSKLSRVGHLEGMMYRALEPGFMQLVIKKNGGIDLFVYTAPEEYLKCNGETRPLNECVESGASEFKVRWGGRLK